MPPGEKGYSIPIFFHPDYTVGTGVPPVQLARADSTADREFHPALKTSLFPCLCFHYISNQKFCNNYLSVI